MGNDLTLLDGPTISILSNPALIAINQDPLGMSVFRVWEKPATYLTSSTSSAALYSPSTISFWTGQLNGGDQVVAFLNAGDEFAKMSATYSDIFVDKVTTGSSKPVPLLQQSWDIYDVWGNRMDNATADAVLKGNVTVAEEKGMWWNNTNMLYKDGVKANYSAVLGKKVGTLSPGNTLDAVVESHGVVAYRLRSLGAIGGAKSEL